MNPLPNLGPLNIQVPFVSNGWAVGVLFEAHILVVAFIMGTAWILVYTGSRPRGVHSQRYERFTKTFALWLVVTYSFGATLAVFAITIAFGLFPRYVAVLTSALAVPLLIIFGVWVLMVFGILLYYYLWKIRERHRAIHQAIIVVYAVAETTFVTLISLFTAYQLTPPRTADLAAAVANPTWLPEVLHRNAGNLSFAGYMIAAWAAYRTVRRQREATSVDLAFYHWAAHLGFLWGVGWELAQLPIGTYYVLAIQQAGPQTYSTMMLVPGIAWEWILQITLVGLVFLLGDLYIWSSLRWAISTRRGEQAVARMRALAPAGPLASRAAREPDEVRRVDEAAALGGALARPETEQQGRGAELFTRWALWLMGAAIVLAIIPEGVPVAGSMNAKWVSLGIFLVVSLVGMVLYIRASRSWTWATMPPVARRSLMGIGVCVSVLMVTMGTIRYTNPQTAVINGQVTLPAIHTQTILAPTR
ncbi:MAG: hypothetical protein PVSMB4_07020 [Ktedonobacterales bacterium]